MILEHTAGYETLSSVTMKTTLQKLEIYFHYLV